MKFFNHKKNDLKGQNFSCYLVVMVTFLLTFNLFGQSQKISKEIDEPVFIIRVEQIGQSDDISYSSVLERIYAPCSQWTGGSGGFTSTPFSFISNAGGLGGLNPKMNIPFYARSFSGEAKGSDGSSARVTTSGDGLGYWTEQLGDNNCTRQDDPDEQPSRTMSALFERTEMGARITFDAGLVSAGCGTYIGFISMNQMEVDPKLIRQFCTFEITNEELSNWKKLKKENKQVFVDDNGKLTATATLFVEIESPIKVEVEIAEYDNWIPQGNVKKPEKSGNTLQIKAKVIAKDGNTKDRDAKITFTLNNVSTEPGVCINGPAAEGWDMKFTEEDNPQSNLEISPWEAITSDFVTETEVVVSTYDFGAYGELKVTAEDRDGKPIKVILQGKDRSSMFLPKNELGGHIADAWRMMNGVEGLPSEWDDEKVVGQPVNGDGLSLYEEYRGALAGRSEEGVYTRLSPKEKELFVVDEAVILDEALWKSASGVKAIFVSRTNTKGSGNEARYVNWCSNYAKVGSKHAVVMDTKTKPTEQYVLGEVNLGVTTPSDVTFCCVYPQTALDFVNEIIHKLQIAVENPESAEAEYIRASGLPPKLWKDALERSGPETIDRLVALQLRWTAIHELGHTCGIPGHLDKSNPPKETSQGYPQCFMRYTKNKENALHLLLQILFPGTETSMNYTLFCTEGYNCMGSINVKDP